MQEAEPGLLHLGGVVEHAANQGSIALTTESRWALDWAGGIARVSDAEILAVQVFEPYVEWTPITGPKNWRCDV